MASFWEKKLKIGKFEKKKTKTIAGQGLDLRAEKNLLEFNSDKKYNINGKDS